MGASDTLLNGRPCSSNLAANRGLAYGDGLFETLRINGGKPLWLDDHLERLLAGGRRLDLAIDRPALEEEISLLCQRASDGPQVLKILCFRRAGGRGYQAASQHAERLLSLWPLSATQAWQDGAKLMLCQTRLAISPPLAGLKHCNRLEQVSAAKELAGSGCDEGLMLDVSGRLIEGSRSNVFIVRGGELLTPRLDESGVAGIMRSRVIRWANQLGPGCREVNMGPSILAAAEEIFVCNSVFGLWPVTAVGCLKKAPGPVCRSLQEYFESEFHV